MAKDRARDDRRSVGSHEKMMGALGRAAGARTVDNFIVSKLKVRKGKDSVMNHDIKGKGHITVGNAITEPYNGTTEVIKASSWDNTRADSTVASNPHAYGYQGTAGISGEHRGTRGAPSNWRAGEHFEETHGRKSVGKNDQKDNAKNNG